MSVTDRGFYEFGSYRLIPLEHVLLRDGQAVALPPKAFDLLVALVVRAGRLVTKEALLKEVWPETFVEEANLSYTVSILRKALGDESEPHRYIETVPKRGYRFTAALAPPADEPEQATQPLRLGLPRAPILATTIGVAVVAGLVFVGVRDTVVPPSPARFQLLPPAGVIVENAQISPDGRRIAFIGRDAAGRGIARRKIWLQDLDSIAAVPLAGTETAAGLFWAPDSQSLAFQDAQAGSLKRISVAGGPAQTLCAATNATGTWSRAGVILFQHGLVPGVLLQVPASGGTPVPATTLDASRRELFHTSPHFLPDGHHFSYVVRSADKWSGLYVGSLGSTQAKRLLEVETPAIFSSGHLIFSRDGAIMAQPFDLTRLELSGEAKALTQDADDQRFGRLQFWTSEHPVPGFGVSFLVGVIGAAVFSAADTGTLAYSLFEPYQFQFAWVDRHGSPLGDLGPAGPFRTFDLSPDGKRLVVSRTDVDRANLWVVDVARAVPSQITFGRRFDQDPRWSPDGTRLAATTVLEDGTREVVEFGLDGQLSEVLADAFLDDWHDGHRLLVRGGGLGIRALSLASSRTQVTVYRPPAGAVDQSSVSPNGRWVAYNSNESGKFEVYVQPFPSGERKQVSTAGVQPVWRSDSRELYYLDPDGRMFSVSIGGGKTLEVGLAQFLFQSPLGPARPDAEQYATVDGRRFLMLKRVDGRQRPVNVILNWPALVRR